MIPWVMAAAVSEALEQSVAQLTQSEPCALRRVQGLRFRD